MEPINKNLPENCDPVGIIDKKTGLEKFVYMCTKPFEKRIEHYRKHSLHFWTDLVLVSTVIILIAVIISLYVYNMSRLVNMVDFQVGYDQAQLINGKQVDFNVQFKNTSKRMPAVDANVAVKLPKSLHAVAVDSKDYNAATQTISLGTLNPQQAGSFKVSGLLLGNLNQKDKFLFVLTYQTPTGLAQQEFTARDFEIDQSVVNLTLKLPAKIIIGSAFPSSVTAENTGDQPFANLHAKLIFPPSFQGADNNEIAMDRLDPHGSQEVRGTGTVTDSRPGTLDFGAQLIATVDGEDFILSSTTVKGNLDFAKLALRFADTDKTPNLNPGDQAPLTVAIENNESANIDDLAVSVTFSGEYVNEQFLKNSYAADYTGGAVQLKTLTAVESGKTISGPVTVAALPFITVKQKPDQGPSITATIRATYTLDHVNTIFVNSQPLIIPINSTLSLSSKGVFTTKDGDQIGVGSIPPRPGEYTAYWAILTLANGVNKVRNVTVHATIPANVEYDEVNNVTNGVAIRKIGNGQIEWFIPELDAYDGILNAPSEARLQLAIVPEDTDINKVMTLLTNITVTGVDDRTGYTVTGKAKDVTTAIFNDPKKDRVAE